MIKISDVLKSLIWLGPLVAFILAVSLPYIGWSKEAAITLAIIFLCALWWATEVVPIPVTSLIPLALFPLLGVLSPKQVAQAYGDPFILLLMGGSLLSTAMSHSGAHRRIALLMVNLFGGSSFRHVVFGFMAASAMLSMWISNTATTLMLLPIALAVIQGTNSQKLAIPLLLGVCYAASIGGMGTPIGTPPNLIFMRIYTEATGVDFSFSLWLSWGIPVVLLLLPVAGIWLTRNLSHDGKIQLPENEKWSAIQVRVLLVFAVTACLWITRKEPFGGWSQLFDLPNANDASVVLLAVVALFVIPDGRGGKLLTWESARNIPWGILLMFSSGLCIASAFGQSGLANSLAGNLSGVGALPIFITVILLCLMVTFLTEFTSNTATTALLMPVLATVGVTIGVEPTILMIPAAFSASCAFMLPVATAPNAIVFGSEQVPIQAMIRNGLLLNLLGAIIISTFCYLRSGAFG